jgi:hypothetical protein
MAERFINNFDIGINKDEQEQKQLILYKKLASLKELQPVYVYAQISAQVTPGTPPVVSDIGTLIRVYVNNINKLNNTVPYDYVYEVSLLDAQVDRINQPTILQTLYLSTSLTNEPFDFKVSNNSDSTFNNKIYVFSKTFPSEFTLTYGHCTTQQNSINYGQYDDFNENTPISDPVYYDQSCTNIQLRFAIRQVHTF